MKYDAVIVGGGLFGQTIARALRAEGRSVMVYDSREPLAGSKPAACLMKPSWFSGLGKDVYEPSLKLLDELFGVQDIVFQTRPKLLDVTVHWCDPADILSGPTSPAVVENVGAGFVDAGGQRIEADLVVVAAGVWTEVLLPQFRQTAQRGMAFLWPGHNIEKPFIKPWAPYRQLVAFNRGDGVWVGDGTAIKHTNWTDDREKASMGRCAEAAQLPIEGDLPKSIPGLRPYAKMKPCMLEELEPGLWVATGGAKNGTIAAGYCAHVIRESTNG